MKNLIFAIRPLVSDFLSTILLLVLLAAGVEVRIATACAIVFGVAHVALLKLLRRPVAALQWAGMGLVVVLGGASILTHDPRFIMIKPTIVNLAIAAVMLKRGWMLRYMPPIAQGHGDDVMIGFGYVWSGLMALTAMINLVVAIYVPQAWVAFMGVFPMASMLALFAVQYLTVRSVVKPRVIAAMTAQAQAAAQTLAQAA